MSDLDTPLFPREPHRMAASSDNLHVVEKAKNMSASDCFRSRSTVLQGQPFGGIPTVLLINIILWMVSPGQGHGQTGGLSWERTVELSQVMPQGYQLFTGHQPQCGDSYVGLGGGRGWKNKLPPMCHCPKAPWQCPGLPGTLLLLISSREVLLNSSKHAPVPSFNKL